ncbi:MAG: hypothetical protein ABI602_02985 [Candidatus Saccharibacteria bacterium]
MRSKIFNVAFQSDPLLSALVVLTIVGQVYLYLESSCNSSWANYLVWPIALISAACFILIAYRLTIHFLHKHMIIFIIVIVILGAAALYGTFILTLVDVWHNAGFNCLSY